MPFDYNFGRFPLQFLDRSSVFRKTGIEIALYINYLRIALINPVSNSLRNWFVRFFVRNISYFCIHIDRPTL